MRTARQHFQPNRLSDFLSSSRGEEEKKDKIFILTFFSSSPPPPPPPPLPPSLSRPRLRAPSCEGCFTTSGDPDSNQGPSDICEIYSQMLCQLSYRRLVPSWCLRLRSAVAAKTPASSFLFPPLPCPQRPFAPTGRPLRKGKGWVKALRREIEPFCEASEKHPRQQKGFSCGALAPALGPLLRSLARFIRDGSFEEQADAMVLVFS